MAVANLHWAATTAMAVALVPAFFAAQLPLRIDWRGFIMIYWVSLTARSIFFTVILYSAASPCKTFGTLLNRCCNQKSRFIFLGLFIATMIWAFSWNVAVIIIVDVIAILELHDRGELPRVRRLIPVILMAGTYLFVGMVLMMCYNDVIASLKYAGSFDGALNRLDAFLFDGLTVSQVANVARLWIPQWGFSLLGIIYFGMFGQIGTGLFITSQFGAKRTFEYVGTLLTSFYIALLIFLVWPSMGPFSLVPLSQMQPASSIRSIQVALVQEAHRFVSHQNSPGVGTDYYIGFPCMHIAQPLIVLWFLRKSRRIRSLLIAYDIFLVAAIILLQWHFFTDLLGGILVAAVAIGMTEYSRSDRLTIRELTQRPARSLNSIETC